MKEKGKKHTHREEKKEINKRYAMHVNQTIVKSKTETQEKYYLYY